MSQAEPAAAVGSGSVRFGLLRVGGTDLALPLSALREAIACPAELTALPVSADGLVGALEVRALIVPVLDLRHLLDLPPVDRAGQVVLVVAQDDHVVGVLADQVRGIVTVPEQDLLQLRAAPGEGRPLLFSSAFRQPDGQGIASVLDAATLLTLPGLPVVRDSAPSSPAALSATTSTSGGLFAVLRRGGHVLAVEAEHVHSLLPWSPPAPSVLDSELCSGVTGYLDREVAVVEPLALLGLPSDAPVAGGAGLVLDLEHGYVVLALDALVDLRRLPPGAVLPLPALTTARPDLLAGLAELPGIGRCVVLDGAALRADPDLLTLSALNTATGEDALAAGGRSGAAAPDRGPSYLRYAVGIDLATPLDQVAEILPLPAGCSAAGGTDPSLLGVVAHRDRSLPVLCLRTLLGAPAPAAAPTERCVLVVEVGDQPVAFAVDALHAIEPRVWQDDDVAGADPAGGTCLQSSRLISVGDSSRLLPELDLLALATLLLAGEGAGRARTATPADPERAVRAG